MANKIKNDKGEATAHAPDGPAEKCAVCGHGIARVGDLTDSGYLHEEGGVKSVQCLHDHDCKCRLPCAHKKKEPRKPIPFLKTYTFKIALIFIGWTLGIQIFIMALFIYVPSIDSLLNRYSLSDMQAVGWASAIIVLYGVSRQEQYMWQKFGMRMGVDESQTDEEVQNDLLTEVSEYWREFLRPILDEVRSEWKELTPKEQKEVLDDVRAQVKKKMKELREGPKEVPVPEGRFGDVRDNP